MNPTCLDLFRLVFLYVLLCCKFTKSQEKVKVTCISCKEKTSELKAVLGEELKFRYTVNSSDLHLLEIIFNGTERIAVSPVRININGVIEERLIVPEKISDGGNQRYLDISLSPITHKDDGATFAYTLKDKKLKSYKGENVIKVEVKSSGSEKGAVMDTNVLIIGVILAVIILVMVILIFLVYKGLISFVWCYKRCCHKRYALKNRPYHIGNYGEKVYDDDVEKPYEKAPSEDKDCLQTYFEESNGIMI